MVGGISFQGQGMWQRRVAYETRLESCDSPCVSVSDTAKMPPMDPLVLASCSTFNGACRFAQRRRARSLRTLPCVSTPAVVTENGASLEKEPLVFYQGSKVNRI